MKGILQRSRWRRY